MSFKLPKSAQNMQFHKKEPIAGFWYKYFGQTVVLLFVLEFI